jgi:chorismate mutase / prephenate dehydratase
MNSNSTDISASNIPPELATLRSQIDEVDSQLIALLQKRANLAMAVGEVKKKIDAPVYRPEREAQILANFANPELATKYAGPLRAPALQAIYREVISACRELERRVRVAYLGPAGTYSEIAAFKHFGNGIEPVACTSFDEVFRCTESGNADFGVVPLENSTEGAVNRNLDLMLASALNICGETSVPVQHCLMSLSGGMQGITRICAHSQALAQCAGYLDKNYPNLERVPVSSNAEGARLASLDAHTAGIGHEMSAQRYGVSLIAKAIQDDVSNRTRFAVIGRYEPAASGADQTSLILSVPDKAGAVHALIEPLARFNVSMKRFESRPARQGTWEYYFYIDLLGHQSDPNVAAALAQIKSNSAFYKVVGSYPRALL